MADVTELIESLKRNIAKRFENTFLVSFLCAFALSNYQILLAIFGDGNFKEKIQFINSLYSLRDKLGWLHLVIQPIAGAAFYTFVWPILDSQISVWSIAIDDYKKKKIDIAQRKTHITDEERIALYLDFDKERAALEKRLGAAAQAAKVAEADAKTHARVAIERCSALAWVRAAEKTGYLPDQLREAISLLAFDQTPLPADLLPGIEGNQFVAHLATVANYLHQLQSDIDNTFSTLDTWRSDPLARVKIPMMAETVYEMLRSLNLVSSQRDRDGSFQIYLYHRDALARLAGIKVS